MSFRIDAKFTGVENYMKKMPVVLTKELSEAVDNTSRFALRRVRTGVSKGSGALRNSYQRTRRGRLAQKIYSNLKYADAVEFGFKRGVVRPVSKKMLLFAIKKEAKRMDGGVRQGSKRAFFNMLKKGKSIREATNATGVVMTKKARAASFKGTKKITNEIVPAIDKVHMVNVQKAIRRSI